MSQISIPLPQGALPLVAIIMGSSSDWIIMQEAANILQEFSIPYEAKVISAHRMPDTMFEYANLAEKRGLRAIIAGAGGAAHLPGMLAAKTTIPILGVPIANTALNGQDAMLSILQMPKGVPVATFSIGAAGACNAALYAIAMLATTDDNINKKLHEFRLRQTKAAKALTL